MPVSLPSREPANDIEEGPVFVRDRFNLNCNYFTDYEMKRCLFIGALWFVTYLIIIALTISNRQALDDAFSARQAQLFRRPLIKQKRLAGSPSDVLLSGYPKARNAVLNSGR